MNEEYYKSLYDKALEDVIRLSKENAELKNENAKLKLEIGKLQGELDYKNQEEKEAEQHLENIKIEIK